MHRKLNGSLPPSLETLFCLQADQNIQTRTTYHFRETFTRKLYCTKTAFWQGPRLWNSIVAPHFLLSEIPELSKETIKKHTKTQLILNYT